MKTKISVIIISIILCITSCTTTNIEDKVKSARFKMETAYNEGDSRDTWNLRNDADFEIQVADGVWWVPANTLGKTRYTNKQIATIVKENPKVKKKLIGNLYEAIQLYQICDFAEASGSEANVREKDSYNGYRWEKHTPGYYAVKLNQGNCATDTNWLIYLLEDDYDEWGTLHYQSADGSGHVINYFFYDGYYYFIDMTHYRNDSFIDARSAVENGAYIAYRNTDFISANIHKAISPEAYVNYCLRNFYNPCSFFYMIKGHEVPDITSDKSRTPVHMVFDSKVEKDITILYLDDDKMSYGFYKNNTSNFDWSTKTKHSFGTITEFL